MQCMYKMIIYLTHTHIYINTYVCVYVHCTMCRVLEIHSQRSQLHVWGQVSWPWPAWHTWRDWIDRWWVMAWQVGSWNGTRWIVTRSLYIIWNHMIYNYNIYIIIIYIYILYYIVYLSIYLYNLFIHTHTGRKTCFSIGCIGSIHLEACRVWNLNKY